MADLSILDQSVAKLSEAAAGLPLDDLLALRGVEQLGKTRKGAIAVLEELIAAHAPQAEPEPPACHAEDEPIADEEPDGQCVFVNDSDLTTVHLGDGRRVAPGESVPVPPSLLAILKPDA